MQKFIVYHLLSFLLLIAINAIGFLLATDSPDMAIFSYWATFLCIIAICIASGIFSVIKLNSPYIPAIINVLVVSAIVVFTRDLWEGVYSFFIPLGAGAITFLAAGITAGVRFSATHPLLQTKYLGVLTVVILAILGLYLGMAYLSLLAYSPFKEEWFFTYSTESYLEKRYPPELTSEQPEDMPTNYWDAQILYDSRTDQPYTGLSYDYAKKLKINPTKPKITGLSYFIEGHFVGHSTKPGSSEHGLIQDDVPDCNPGFSPHAQRLLHKDYVSILEMELASWGEYTVVSADELSLGTDDSFWGTPDIVIEYKQGGVQYKKEIYLYPNGLIWEMRPYTLDGTGNWQDEGRLLIFDSLGFCMRDEMLYANGTVDDNERANAVWDSNDFVFVDYYPTLKE